MNKLIQMKDHAPRRFAAILIPALALLSAPNLCLAKTSVARHGNRVVLQNDRVKVEYDLVNGTYSARSRKDKSSNLIGAGLRINEFSSEAAGLTRTSTASASVAATDGGLLTKVVSAPDRPDQSLESGGPFLFAKPGDGTRTYVRTARGDFAKGSFQAEVTTTLQGGGGAGCAFFGMGCGQGNAGAFQEPSTAPSVYVRLAPSDFADGVVTTSVNGQESRSSAASVGDGTHRVRLTWDAAGKRALFEIDANWNGQSFRAGSSATVDGAAVNFGGEARLFVGGANGVRFTRFTTKPLTESELKAVGFGEVFASDPTAGTWLAQAKGARFIQSLRAGKKVIIVTMGTSLTGGAWRWPDVMMNDWLNREWPGQVTLYNEGVGASASSVGFNGNPATSGLGKTEGYQQVLLPAPKASLCPPKAPDAARAGVGAFLEPLAGELRLLACWYDGSKLAASRPFVAGELRTADSRWTCEVRATPVAGEPDALDLAITFKLAEGLAKSAGVAVAFDFADWSTNNYVMIPAAIYGGNRNRIEYRGYCTGFNPEDFYNQDLPVTHGDVPRLELEPGKPSKIEVNASNATTPAMCFYNRQIQRAFIVLAEQGIREGGQILDNGLMIEESQDRSHATLVVSAPGVRERKPEFIGFSASPDRGIHWQAGKETTLRLRVYSFAATDIPGLLEKFMTVRKAVTGPNHPRHRIPFSEVARLMTGRIDSRWHENTAGQYYGDSNCDSITLGWVGGLMNTFPMFALGDERHRGRAMKTFDFVIPAALGKSGYFLASVNADGKASGRDWYPKQPIVLTRQNADVLFWMTKQFLLLKAQGQAAALKPEWEQAVKRLAQAFVNTWKRHGQWGNYVNHETGDIVIYNSTGGAMAIGGLAWAASWFNQPEFMSVAKEAADYYYREDFLQKGFTFGACSDIMQNADSETAAGLMTALMALYETTGERRWLEMSRNLANLTATWTVSYDYELPANTELAQLGAKLAGVYWASTQNKHGAPGICTSSGDALFKIYRATGDRRYAELLRDLVHAHAEGIKPKGEITERLTYCDADSRGSRGGGSTGWNELNGILMALELPGIYVRTDQDEMFVFDHVEAQVIQRNPAGVTLKITNPTQFDAQVTIFTEGEPQARQPLGTTAFLQWPKAEIKSGATIQVTLNQPQR